MRKTVLLLLLSASVAAALDPRVAPGFDLIREKDLRADLTFLASDALEGRWSLRRGSEAAIQFIVAEFTKAGLKPLTGNSFLQTVPLIEYRADGEETRITLERGGQKKVFRYFRDFYGSGPNEGTVRAPVVFAGYGITAPEFGYDDYAGIDARGKIVLVFDHEPQETDPHSRFNGLGNTRYANTVVKIVNARKHGAVGLLVAAEPNRKHLSTEDRIRTVPGGGDRLLRLPPQALAEREANLPMLSISDALTAKLMSAIHRKPGEVQAAIDASLKPLSAPLPDTQVEMRIVLRERRRGNSANVIGMLEGSDPQGRNESVFFTGHYDHDGDWDGQVHPGADDNGSGTVGVIELARAFARNPERPKRTLVFAIFAAEERGLLGSYYYVEHPLRPLASTRAVINFDMIGRNETPSPQTNGLIQIAPDTSNELNLIGTINSPAYRTTVERGNEEVGLRLNYKWDQDAALNIFQRSDQFPFTLHNIPAVWWFTGFHPDYHQVGDTVDKINFAKMEKILKLAYLTGFAFADQAEPPRFLERP
jgi:hypothetical protein